MTVSRPALACPISTTGGSLAQTQASTRERCRRRRRNIGKPDAAAWSKRKGHARVPPVSQGRMAAYRAGAIMDQPGHHWLRLRADRPPLDEANGRQGFEQPAARRRMGPHRNGSTCVLARTLGRRDESRDQCTGHTQLERIPARRYNAGWQNEAVQRLPPRRRIQVMPLGGLVVPVEGAHPKPQGRSFPRRVAQTPTQTPASQTKHPKELVCRPPVAPVLAPDFPVQRGLVTPHSYEAIYG